MKKTGTFLTGLLAGVAAGAVAALLLTPKKGEEAREIITGRAVDLKERASGPIESLRNRARRVRGQSSVEESAEEAANDSANGSTERD